MENVISSGDTRQDKHYFQVFSKVRNSVGFHGQLPKEFEGRGETVDQHDHKGNPCKVTSRALRTYSIKNIGKVQEGDGANHCNAG